MENAVKLISDPAFEFEQNEPAEEEAQKSVDIIEIWPFLNPEIIPNPDADYQKKRVI